MSVAERRSSNKLKTEKKFFDILIQSGDTIQ